MVVFVTHWMAVGDEWRVTHARQLRATLDFMSLEREGHLDQVVLSSERYVQTAPGLVRRDTTILP
jgi:hypothetical protein